MEKEIKKTQVKIRCEKDKTVVTNSEGNKWTFEGDYLVDTALSLLVSYTLHHQFEKQKAFRDTFTITMIVE